jgi:sec-independent protein translocase protein TatB
MLGLGWTEMLVIGVVALIVIGPKDLPVVMNRIGKIFGQVKRMGSEFQREINRSTGLSEVRNLRDSLTAPLKQTADEIRKEFNAMTPTGAKPTGVLKPSDPAVESVVDDIKAKAGMTTPSTVPQSADDVAKAAGFKPAGPAPTVPKTTLVTEPKAKKAPVRAKAAPTRPVVKTDLEALPAEPVAKPVATKAPAAKSSSTKSNSVQPAAAKTAPEARKTAAKPAVNADVAAAPTPKKRAPAKPKPTPASADKAGDQ